MKEGHALFPDIAHGRISGIVHRQIARDVNVLRVRSEKRDETKKYGCEQKCPTADFSQVHFGSPSPRGEMLYSERANRVP